MSFTDSHMHTTQQNIRSLNFLIQYFCQLKIYQTQLIPLPTTYLYSSCISFIHSPLVHQPVCSSSGAALATQWRERDGGGRGRERVTFMLSRNLPISRRMTSLFSSEMSASSSTLAVFEICSSETNPAVLRHSHYYLYTQYTIHHRGRRL